MFRPIFTSARTTLLTSARQAGRRHNSSHAAPSGDTRWLLGAVAVTVPALGYLLAPPDKKAHAHKAAHNAAAEAGLVEPKDDDEHPEEVHGPDSRASAKSQEISQSAESHREQASRQPTKQAKDDASSTNADVFSKQAGLSNTETKHKVKVSKVDGENPTAKASTTVDPKQERGKEKQGRSAAAQDEDDEDDDEDDEDDDEDDEDEDEED